MCEANSFEINKNVSKSLLDIFDNFLENENFENESSQPNDKTSEVRGLNNASYALACKLSPRYNIVCNESLEQFSLSLSTTSSLSDKVFLSSEDLKPCSSEFFSRDSPKMDCYETGQFVEMRHSRKFNNRDACISLDLYPRDKMHQTKRNKSLNDGDYLKFIFDFRHQNVIDNKDEPLYEQLWKCRTETLLSPHIRLNSEWLDSFSNIPNVIVEEPKLEQVKCTTVPNNSSSRNKYSDINMNDFVRKFNENRSSDIFEDVIAWKKMLKCTDYIEDEEHEWMVIDPELVEEQKGKSTSQELVVPKLVSFKPISAASQAAFRNELQGRLVEMHQPSTSTANDDVVCLRSDENTPADLTPPQRRVISRSTESIFEGAGPQLRTSVKNDRRKLKSVLVIPPHSGLSSKGPISLDVEKSDTKLPATNTTDDDVISNKKGKSENLDREQAKFNLLKWFRKRPPMDTLIKKGIIQGTIFGASLESLCVGLGALTPHVPPFVRACTERLENTEGFMESDGLYRASANLSTIQRLRIQVNQGILDAIREEEDPHVIAGSLKLFFRELKEPLIPFNAFHSFLEANAIPDDNERVLRLRDLVHCLPICNRDTLQHLVAHLIRVTECSQANRMHVNNLSIVWGPSLMWIPPASVADDQPNNAPRSPSAVCFDLAIHCFEQNRVIDTLITNHEQIFL